LVDFVILSEAKKVHCKMRFFYEIQSVIAVDGHYLVTMGVIGCGIGFMIELVKRPERI
jgi:hypothetical protein